MRQDGPDIARKVADAAQVRQALVLAQEAQVARHRLRKERVRL